MVLAAESTAESRSGVEFAFETVQCPAAQQGMAAYIAAIGMAEPATQQTPTAGTVMTNARAETTNTVANVWSSKFGAKSRLSELLGQDPYSVCGATSIARSLPADQIE